jgi:hypothetical protein
MFASEGANQVEEKSCMLHAATSQVVCPLNLCDVCR